MPSFQTKVLVVAIYSTQLHGWFGKRVPIKLSFLFRKLILLFGIPLNLYQTEIWFVRCIHVRILCKDSRSIAVSVQDP